jgi:hypothetical protein
MTAYIPTLTQAGLAAIVNVQAGTIGPVEISEIGLTDAQFTVASTLEALPGEIKRLPVSGDTLGDDVIHVQALDTSSDVYGYTGFALYTSTGLLFAVYGQADVIAQKVAGSTSYIAIDIQMARGQADAITFGDTNFLNPPATTESQGVVELATADEAKAGTDDLRALTPATALAALLSWLLSLDGGEQDRCGSARWSGGRVVRRCCVASGLYAAGGQCLHRRRYHLPPRLHPAGRRRFHPRGGRRLHG